MRKMETIETKSNIPLPKNWEKRGDDFFRCDEAYAGKDHTKNNKTFIALGPLGFEELSGFKSVDNAIKAADEKWPVNA